MTSKGPAEYKISDKSEMVGEIIGWFDKELPQLPCVLETSGTDSTGKCVSLPLPC